MVGSLHWRASTLLPPGRGLDAIPLYPPSCPTHLDNKVGAVRGDGGVTALEGIHTAALGQGAEGHVVTEVNHLLVKGEGFRVWTSGSITGWLGLRGRG